MADTLIQGTTIVEDKRTGVAEIWSAPGAAFHTDDNSKDFSAGGDDWGEYNVAVAGDQPVCPVNLPDGVTIDECIVWGTDSADTWKLYAKDLDNHIVPTEVAGTTINSTDSSTTKVNNSEYGYFIQVFGLATDQEIYGARIKYTV